MSKKSEPKPILVSSLDIKKTPLPKKKRRAKTTGKRYHAGIRSFLYSLFELNEKLPKSKKLSDGEIIRQVLIEFSNVPTIYRRWKEQQQRAVSVHRSEYNRGRLIPHKGPPKTPEQVSLAYDEEGFPVNLHWSRPKRMSALEIKERREKTFKKYSVPWLEEQERIEKELAHGG